MTDVDAVIADAVRAELGKLLGSVPFRRSKRLRRFLTLTVEAVLQGQAEQIKEHRIGVEVFDRGVQFDPARDNIVRIEAARLRHKLREYYESDGCADRVRIDMPKGTYVPVFEIREALVPPKAPIPEQRSQVARSPRKWIVGAVAAAIAVIFAGFTLQHANRSEQKPIDPQARLLYEKGRHLWNQRTVDSLKKSVTCYRQAIEREPKYADAWTGLADSYAVLVANHYADSDSYIGDGRTAATTAIRLNPHAGRPHSALACFYAALGDWALADRENKLAIQLSPNDSTARQWYGDFLMSRGRFDEALVELQKAEQLDPLVPMIGVNIGDLYFARREYDKALVQYRKMLDLDGACVAAEIGIQTVLIAEHQYTQVLSELRRWLPMYPDEPAFKKVRAICLRALAAARERSKRDSYARTPGG